MGNGKHKQPVFLCQIIRLLNSLVSLLILLGMFALVVYLGYKVYEIGLAAVQLNFSKTLHDLAVLVVLVKAYRILLYYYQEHHISITYIVEISIIAPAIELLFAPTNHTLGVNILLATFGIANLILYLLFFSKMSAADDEDSRRSQLMEDGLIISA